jgi:hypothetical protein
MNKHIIKLIRSVRGESCARMRKRIRSSNERMFYGRVMTTNIYQAMDKL